jgi:hypothetical protein
MHIKGYLIPSQYESGLAKKLLIETWNKLVGDRESYVSWLPPEVALVEASMRQVSP